MKVTDLIARAAASAIAEDAQLLGVRICPVALTPEDVEPLQKGLAAAVGKDAFIAVSIPDAKRLKFQLCATAWRSIWSRTTPASSSAC